MRVWGVERRRQELTEFYTSSKDDCLRIVLVSVGDRQLAEDLVAEAFTRPGCPGARCASTRVPRAWVVRTALNTHVSIVPAPSARDDGGGPRGPDSSGPAGTELVIGIGTLRQGVQALARCSVWPDKVRYATPVGGRGWIPQGGEANAF